MFGKLRGPVQKAPTLMSRSLLRQMRWEGWKEETTASLELLVEGHHGASEFKVTIVEEESPMLVLGADVVKWLRGCGMSWEAVAAPEEETCFAVPQFRAGALVMDDEGWSPPGEDVDTQEFEARRWDALVEQHQRAAVEGEEPGNLESGGDCAPQQGVLSDVLTESWRELASVKDCDLPSGPATMTPADNPEKYKDIKDAFEPGLIHKHAEAWAEMDPAPDSEVLHWVRHMYKVQVHEGATGLECTNGKVARQNMEALSAIMKKRLRERSWEATTFVINVVPLNLVDKPTADPPFRMVVNGIPLNEHYVTWRIRYEGVKTIPLTVKHRSWIFSVDLESGYDALLLDEDSRKLFGAKIWITRKDFDELVAEGILTEEHVKRRKKGKVEVLVQACTLVQGWTNSCAVFTKLTNQLVRVWRKRGYNLVHILDDFLFAVDGTFEEACAVRDAVVADVKRLGFCLNYKKAVLTPNRCQIFLGVVVNTLQMKFFMPGEKIENIEGLIKKFLGAPEEVTFRQMASIAGKILATAVAISCSRLFTRATYKCICPDGEWDDIGEVSKEMVEELSQALKWIRRFNKFGSPIRRRAKATGIRIMMDASVHGFGCRIDGKDRDVVWRPTSYAIAAEWSGDVFEFQAHRELAAFHELAWNPEYADLLRGQQILLWTDSMATKAYINKGSGPSAIMTALMKDIWTRCIELGIGVWAEHVKGDLLVVAGVDAMSRHTEFMLSTNEFRKLNESPQFGRRAGFEGFTIDACASEKTKQLPRYFSRDASGRDSLGDLRTVKLKPKEHYYLCPPPSFIQKVILRLAEDKVAGVLVVPNWIGSAWHTWCCNRAVAIEKLPWRGGRATWWDATEKKRKPHGWAQQWEFIAVAFDFREEMEHVAKGRQAPPRAKDAERRQPRRRLDFGGKGGLKKQSVNKIWERSTVLQVLSLCGGMGTAGWALKKVLKQLGLDIKFKVLEIEYDEVARAMAQHMAGDVSEQLKPHDLWEWAVNEGLAKKWLEDFGEIHCVLVGFACQDMSVAHRRGAGLYGERSGVYFAARQLLQYVVDLYPRASFLFECTVFKDKHPQDWAFVGHSLGVKPRVVDAGWIAPVWRKRAFWSSFEMLEMERREITPGHHQQGCLEVGRRPTLRWRARMPTIMACGSSSWNQKRCVQMKVKCGWVDGPLRIGEVEQLMGFKKGSTEGALLNGEPLTEKQRWKCIGNAIHASVMCHWMVSLLVTKGYITRDDPRLKGQIWTVNQDGPATVTPGHLMSEVELALGDAVANAGWDHVLYPMSQKPLVSRAPSALERGVGSEYSSDEEGDGPMRLKHSAKVKPVRRASQARRAMAVAAEAGPAAAGGAVFVNVYDTVDSKGVPKLRHVKRKAGMDKPVQPKGAEFWKFVDEMSMDLMILSRAENTWKMYAAWWGVFEEWAAVMGITWMEQPDIKLMQTVLHRSLVLMWYGANYATKTLELYVTAVAAHIRDKGWGNVRDSREVQRVMEGIRRKQGCAVKKKLPLEGHHLAALLRMEPPKRGSGWTGSKEVVALQWHQFTTMVAVAWGAFLRMCEILQLQVCDLTWEADAVHILIRKTKNDQRTVTTTTTLEGARPDSELCLVRTLHEYMHTLFGGVGRQKGCTRDVHKAFECSKCPRLFPKVLRNGAFIYAEASERTLRKRLKSALKRLITAGWIPPEQYSVMSIGSLRKGGNSTAAVYGIREAVREKHGRWGLAARARSGTAEPEYNMILEGERQGVSMALHRSLNGDKRKIGDTMVMVQPKIRKGKGGSHGTMRVRR